MRENGWYAIMEKKLGGFAMLDEIIKTQEDFSSSIVTAEAVLNIAYALEEEYQKMMKLFEEEETQNKKLKPEYQEYKYKKGFTRLSFVFYYNDKHSREEVDSYETMYKLYQKGKLENVSNILMVCNLDYSSMKGKILQSRKRFENKIEIIFKPYDIKLIKTTNTKEPLIDNIFKRLVDEMRKMKVENTVFCSNKAFNRQIRNENVQTIRKETGQTNVKNQELEEKKQLKRIVTAMVNATKEEWTTIQLKAIKETNSVDLKMAIWKKDGKLMSHQSLDTTSLNNIKSEVMKLIQLTSTEQKKKWDTLNMIVKENGQVGFEYGYNDK